ncbi:MAG: HlyD family efflux transporter periplasmic adaptor subunit [Gammaproteobacteria bacterium]|nr:HlyD family efflux transporter periplasmic adaptor subunit [Gammaproteobacteria bacterium]
MGLDRMAEHQSSQARPLLALLDLARRARQAEEAAVLRFLAVNDTHELVTYRQSGLWLSGQGVCALSGVVKVEANAPYALWLTRICQFLSESFKNPHALTASDLSGELAGQWSEWLPEHGLWLPIVADGDVMDGGLLLARDLPWTERDIALLGEWMGIWEHAWRALHSARAVKGNWFTRLLAIGQRPGDRKSRIRKVWWRRPVTLLLSVLLIISFIPVRLAILAPAELVPSDPAVIRSPLEGVLGTFHVEPNQNVQEGDLLFEFDEAIIRSRLDVARFALATAESEYRQVAQQALSDERSKALLSSLTGSIEERRAEALFQEEQLTRTKVLAPRSGIVLFDDPSEWVGRPVRIGERIMRIAAAEDIEVEAWVPIADAIPLAMGAPVSLYLNASPLDPVRGTLRYLAHDAVERPDGTYAYRLRASIDGEIEHRVGLKGTARASGERVSLIYWVMRRPLASVRALLAI